jgi:DnaJ-class molecular chaperone
MTRRSKETAMTETGNSSPSGVAAYAAAYEPCPVCKGRGALGPSDDEYVCPYCHGLEYVLDMLRDHYKGKKLSLRISVDGVADRGPDHDGPKVVYAQVKTSDLASFLRSECSRVHR